jgi:trehalose 6-phosphate phosphatase
LHSDTSSILTNFFGTFTPSRRPLLLLDYDGTLAPFRVDRFQAVPWPGVRDLLSQIQSQNRTRMVIVTGRPAKEIAPLLCLKQPIEVWGLHGFERLHLDGRREVESISPLAQKKLDEVHAALERDAFGGLFEHKPNAAVLHWRGLPANQAAFAEQHSRALFEPLAGFEGFRLLPFEAGLELRVGRHKGDAVEALLAECNTCAPAAFLGDDLTDEAAFRAVQCRGLSVLVRTEHRETCADLWLKPPEELLQFLQRWLNASG